MSVLTRRFAAVLAAPRGTPARGQVPPGIDSDEFRLALLEDTYEIVAGLELVTVALALSPPADDAAEDVTWPGTPVLRLDGDPLIAALDGMRELGAEQAAVVAPDAPDLPPLLLGKLFRSLGRADVAVCPAEGGGLVALAARLPVPDWFAAARPSLDEDPGQLRAAAPRPGAVRSAPGWHRLRTPQDLARLDPGLEGWENTRVLLEHR